MMRSRSRLQSGFLDALEAYAQWNPGEPEPIVDHPYTNELVPISVVAGLAWNSRAFLPRSGQHWVETTDLDGMVKRWTYGAVAQAMLAKIKQERVAA